MDKDLYSIFFSIFLLKRKKKILIPLYFLVYTYSRLMLDNASFNIRHVQPPLGWQMYDCNFVGTSMDWARTLGNTHPSPRRNTYIYIYTFLLDGTKIQKNLCGYEISSKKNPSGYWMNHHFQSLNIFSLSIFFNVRGMKALREVIALFIYIRIFSGVFLHKKMTLKKVVLRIPSSRIRA